MEDFEMVPILVKFYKHWLHIKDFIYGIFLIVVFALLTLLSLGGTDEAIVSVSIVFTFIAVIFTIVAFVFYKMRYK